MNHAIAAAKANPLLPQAYLQQARLHLLNNEMPKAVPSLDEAFRLGVQDPQERLQYAHVLLRVGRFEEAERNAFQVTTVDPRNPIAWGVLAETRHAQGRMRAAMEALRSGIQVDPGNEALLMLQQRFSQPPSTNRGDTMRWRRCSACLVLAVLLPTACHDGDENQAPVTSIGPPASPPWLQDVAAESGVDFTWRSGASGDYFLPEIIGGGAAMLDFDGDGDLDLYFVQGGLVKTAMNDPSQNPAANRLFRNEGDWRFVEVPGAAGAADPAYGMGVATGDYDNDG